MIQGGSKINKDVPPYVIAAREPICFCGINSIGLRRRGFTDEQINTIQDIYRQIFVSKLNVSQAIAQIETEMPDSAEKQTILSFIKNTPRGIIKGA